MAKGLFNRNVDYDRVKEFYRTLRCTTFNGNQPAPAANHDQIPGSYMQHQCIYCCVNRMFNEQKHLD